MTLRKRLIVRGDEMIKTSKYLSKHLRLSLMFMMSMFLLLETVQAQAINFSSDHWPKRWGRAMNKPDMSAYVYQTRNETSPLKKVRHQGWGQKVHDKRNQRSKTPDYHNGFYNHYESDYLKRRYAVPRSMPYSSAYPANNYYGNYPLMPHLGYPGIIPGVSGIGMGVPGLGFPYSSPFLLAPGLTPGLMPGISPGAGYPW